MKGVFGVEISNFDKSATRAELISWLNQQCTFTFLTVRLTSSLVSLPQCDLVTGASGYPVLNITLKDKNAVNALLGLSGKVTLRGFLGG
jgi:hypothetical protein